jgi:hypothetical protein
LNTNTEELRRRRALEVELGRVGDEPLPIREQPQIIRWHAIRSPMSLVRTRIRVEDDHTAIVVAVGDIDLVGVRIDRQIGRVAEQSPVVAPSALPQLADLREEPSVV